MFSFLKRLLGGGSTPETGKGAAPPADAPAAAPAAEPAPVQADEPAAEEPAGPVAELGFYVDPMALMLPSYIVPGHGFLVLRDFFCDAVWLDGVDIGDPDVPHDQFRGGFRGFFNVPPGKHTLVAVRGDRRSTWELDLSPNDVLVRRIDWEAGGWTDDDEATESQYRQLARSGSMLQAGALRPWPLASVFFLGAPSVVTVDGLPVPASAPRRFFGVTGVTPGDHRLQVGDRNLSLTLPADCRVLVDCTGDDVRPQDPRLGAMMIRTLMLSAPREALLRAADLDTPDPGAADLALGTMADNLARLQELAGGGGVQTRQFDDGDLALLRRSFAQLQADFSDAHIGEYYEVLRHHYILDREMAAQSDYFARYAGEVLQHLQTLPRLAQTRALTYLRYLGEDLQDTGNLALGKLGRQIVAALG